MERQERQKDKTQVNPEPTRPDLFQFVEKLFEGADQKPERIELRQAYGPGCRKYGTTVLQKEYKANSLKPTREQMVALSNELLDAAQTNCNEIGKPHRYGVLPKHYAKSDSYYACFVIAMQPKQRPGYNGLDVEDDDDVESDVKRRDGLLQHSLEHLKTGDEHERWRQDQFSGAVGDIIEKYQSLVDRLMQQNSEFMKEHRELFKAADEALSRKSERDLAAEMQKFKIGMLQNGFDFLKQLAPVAVNQLTGKQTIPTEKSAESIAVSSFLEGLADPQARALFGDIDDDKKELKPNGIFTPAQAMIFFNVARCQEPPAALDKLLEGEHAVTEQQIAKAQAVVSAQQFMPLVALVMGRKRKQLEAESVSATSVPTN